MSYVIQTNIPKDDCTICMETLKDHTKAVIKTQCNHYFHNDCMLDLCESTHANVTCPICRTRLTELDCDLLYAFKEKALDISVVNNFHHKIQIIYNSQTNGGMDISTKRKYKKIRRSRKRRYRLRKTRRT